MKQNVRDRSIWWASVIALCSIVAANPASAAPLTMDVAFQAGSTGTFSFIFDDSTDVGVSRSYTLDAFSWVDPLGRTRSLDEVTSFTATIGLVGSNLVVNPYLLQLTDYTQPCNIGVAGSCVQSVSTVINGIASVNFVFKADYCELLAPGSTDCFTYASITRQSVSPITSTTFSARPVPTTVPEPSTLGLIISAVLAVVGTRRRPRAKSR